MTERSRRRTRPPASRCSFTSKAHREWRLTKSLFSTLARTKPLAIFRLRRNEGASAAPAAAPRQRQRRLRQSLPSFSVSLRWPEIASPVPHSGNSPRDRASVFFVRHSRMPNRSMFLSSRYRAAFFLPFVLLVAPPAFPQQPASRLPTIHISVDRVTVGVVVTDSHGQFVSDLHREDFHLFDNGVEQPITDFFSVDEPAQVLLLIEAGPAVYLLQGGHLQAVHALLDGLSPSDRVAIARYNEAARTHPEFHARQIRTPRRAGPVAFQSWLRPAKSRLQPLHRSRLARARSRQEISGLAFDGVRYFSFRLPLRTLLARLKSTDVRVLAISLGGELRSTNSPEKKHSKKDAAACGKSAMVAEGFAQADEELKRLQKPMEAAPTFLEPARILLTFSRRSHSSFATNTTWASFRPRMTQSYI